MFAHHTGSTHTDQYFGAKRSSATANTGEKQRPAKDFKLIIYIKHSSELIDWGACR